MSDIEGTALRWIIGWVIRKQHYSVIYFTTKEDTIWSYFAKDIPVNTKLGGINYLRVPLEYAEYVWIS